MITVISPERIIPGSENWGPGFWTEMQVDNKNARYVVTRELVERGVGVTLEEAVVHGGGLATTITWSGIYCRPEARKLFDRLVESPEVVVLDQVCGIGFPDNFDPRILAQCREWDMDMKRRVMATFVNRMRTQVLPEHAHIYRRMAQAILPQGQDLLTQEDMHSLIKDLVDKELQPLTFQQKFPSI